MKPLKLVDIGGLFGLMVVLLVAIAFSSASRRRDQFDSGSGGRRGLCGIASAMFEDSCAGNANVQRRLFFGDVGMSTSPNGVNNTDPYHITKVIGGSDQSSLRMTINDNADESFQIWGNACGAGDCSGAGTLAHKFRADGSAAVAGSLSVGHSEGQTAADLGWSSGQYPVGGSLNVYNRHAGNWTHFPWVDGKNYIRNQTQVDGALDVNGRLDVNGGSLCMDGVCATPAALKKVLAMVAEYKGRMSAVEQKNGQQDGRIATLRSGADARDVAYGTAKSGLNTVTSSAGAFDVANKFGIGGASVNVLGATTMDPWKVTSFSDPSAQWIWNDPAAASGASSAVCINFNQQLNMDRAVQATMDIVADNQAVVYINGQSVGKVVGGFGGAAIPQVAVSLRKGVNIINVEAANQDGPAGLLLSLHENGGGVLLRSDASWKWNSKCTAEAGSVPPTPVVPPPPQPAPKAAANAPNIVPVTVYSEPDFRGRSKIIMFDANGCIPFDAHGMFLDAAGIGRGNGQSGGPRSFKIPAGVKLTIYDGEVGG